MPVEHHRRPSDRVTGPPIVDLDDRAIITPCYAPQPQVKSAGAHHHSTVIPYVLPDAYADLELITKDIDGKAGTFDSQNAK